MTLKEKFLPFVDDIDLINDIPNEEWGLRNANKIEVIADEFAIGFAEWRLTTFVKNADEYTMQELLEIYKKEKKL